MRHMSEKTKEVIVESVFFAVVVSSLANIAVQIYLIVNL